MTSKTPVYLEAGKKRTFAMSLDWPGWGRSGATADEALRLFSGYADRYKAVAALANIKFSPGTGLDPEVVETVPGSATTDFGAPGVFVSSDFEPTTAAEAKRLAALMRAAWELFDSFASSSPRELRAGSRGGGRDREKMISHVLESDTTYARRLGIKHKEPALGDEAAISALREAIVEVVGRPSDGKPLTPNGWPIRYAARRIAWHALDHAWEMEDRA